VYDAVSRTAPIFKATRNRCLFHRISFAPGESAMSGEQKKTSLVIEAAIPRSR